MQVRVDFLMNRLVCLPDKKPQKKTVRGERLAWYYRKTPRTLSKIKRMTLFLFWYHEATKRKENRSLFWLTLTTKQHASGCSDSQLLRAIGLWLKNRDFCYLYVCERQRQTGDLHFHLLVSSREQFAINNEIKRWAYLCNVEPHSALFHVKRVSTEGRKAELLHYLTSYVSKKDGAYSSLFLCRTSAYSKSLGTAYKENLWRFRADLERSESLRLMHSITMTNSLDIIKISPFAQVYHLSENIRTKVAMLAGGVTGESAPLPLKGTQKNKQ